MLKIKTNSFGVVTVATQQYSIGTYVCLYSEDGRMLDQFGVSLPKEKFLADVRAGKVFKGEVIEQ